MLFLKDAQLITGEVVAMDGTKVRTNNSKKNNYSPKKIARHLVYIEEKTSEYLAALEQNDLNEKSVEKVKNIQEKIAKLNTNKIKYEQLTKAIETSGEPQISTTDPDARALLVQGQVVEVSYNLQAAVDQKHNLVVATHTINRNDRNAMSGIALETKENLNLKSFTAILDKGYHNGREIETCQRAGITTLVCPPTIVNSKNKGTTSEYMVDKFKYNAASDTYTCPEGNILTTTGSWHHQTSPDSYWEVYNHTNLRGLEKVNGEMALIMTVYNMKRAINILGIEKILEKLKRWKPDYKKGSVFSQKRSILKLYNRFCILAIAKAT